jgi:hypothetical protein
MYVLYISGPENEITAVGDPPHWLRDTPLSANVGTNFANSGGRSIGIVHLHSGHRVCFFSNIYKTHKSHKNWRSEVQYEIETKTAPHGYELDAYLRKSISEHFEQTPYKLCSLYATKVMTILVLAIYKTKISNFAPLLQKSVTETVNKFL